TSAAVLYLNHQPTTGVVAGADGNPSVFGGELNGVLEQVPDDLMQASRVGMNTVISRLQLQRQVNPFVAGVGADHLNDIAHQRMDIQVPLVQHHLAVHH